MLLASKIWPNCAGLRRATSSEPVVMMPTRRGASTSTSPTPAAASAARCRGASRVPAGTITSPRRRSLPRSRTYSPARRERRDLDDGTRQVVVTTEHQFGVFDGDDRVGAGGHRGAGHDPDGRARRQHDGHGVAGGDVARHLEGDRDGLDVAGAHRVSVHLRVAEQRQVDAPSGRRRRSCGPRASASGDDLGRTGHEQWSEHPADSSGVLVDRYGGGHDLSIAPATASMSRGPGVDTAGQHQSGCAGAAPEPAARPRRAGRGGRRSRADRRRAGRPPPPGRAGRRPSGTSSEPGIAAMSASHGSRTSMRVNGSPASQSGAELARRIVGAHTAEQVVVDQPGDRLGLRSRS